MTQQTGASMLARHAARLCTGFGSVPVVYGASTTRGQLDAGSTLATTDGGLVLQHGERLLHVTQAWVDALPSGFGEDAALTIDGTAYTVREVRVLHDQHVAELLVVRDP